MNRKKRTSDLDKDQGKIEKKKKKKAKGKPEDITRWENEGGTVAPTGNLPPTLPDPPQIEQSGNKQ